MMDVVMVSVVMVSVVAPFFPAGLDGQGYLNKDPKIWLDEA